MLVAVGMPACRCCSEENVCLIQVLMMAAGNSMLGKSLAYIYTMDIIEQHDQTRTKDCVLGDHGVRELPFLLLICLHTHHTTHEALL